MREVKRRSALPVYIAAGVFALYALVAPLYSLWHFFLAAVVTAAAWLIADRLVKPVTEYVPEPEPEPVSYGAEADAVLAEAKKARTEMERLAASIADTDVKAKIAKLVQLSDAIAQDAIQDASDIPQIKKFQSYFLPSTIKLLEAYDRMSAPGVAGENTDKARSGIAAMLQTEAAAFQKQLDALYKNDALDVDADIKVMEQLLAREGLTGGDMLKDILRSKQQGQPAQQDK